MRNGARYAKASGRSRKRCRKVIAHQRKGDSMPAHDWKDMPDDDRREFIDDLMRSRQARFPAVAGMGNAGVTSTPWRFDRIPYMARCKDSERNWTVITTCEKCGQAYDETSEDHASSPAGFGVRICDRCRAIGTGKRPEQKKPAAPCPGCNGTGKVIDVFGLAGAPGTERPCPHCQGTGFEMVLR